MGTTAARIARNKQFMDALKATGARCGTCKHFEQPSPPGFPKTTWCSLHSDDGGFQLAATDGLCKDWRVK